MTKRDPQEHIEELQRWHNEACAERDALDAEVKRLTTHVANLERLIADTGDKLQKSREKNIELVEQVAALSHDFHAMSSNFFEHVTATHNGIKRGIELGDLPPDYYARFRTTWAPKK